MGIKDARRITTEELLVDARKTQQAGDTDLETASEGATSTDTTDSEFEASSTDDSELESLGSTAEGPLPRVKRLVPRYAFCSSCREEFGATENPSKSCR
jgi:hypothetical protein